MSTLPNDVRLAPPGAGIPMIERLIGGWMLAWKRWRGTHESFAADFDRERRDIAGLYSGLIDSVLSERVLIPRLTGLEDSSRHWSVYMTLDHLAIVNTHIAHTIRELASGRVPDRVAATAAVKPRPDSGSAVISAYETSCDRVIEVAGSVTELRTLHQYAHPWFGPLDAAGWYAMASTHMGIHRAQIASILSQAASKRH